MSTVYWEDLKEGQEIPAKSIAISAAQLFQVSAATCNTHRIHFDTLWAQHEGYEERVIHGPVQGEILVQTIESWIGTDGWLRKINFSNRRYAVVDENLTGKGKVTRLFQDNGQSFAELEVWVEKDSGEVTVPGTATVELPTRERAIEVPQD
ncbi:MAG: hypothetical protein KUG72_03585 [Pseudomonadales bacterium]|nr:hypothetical protein [Pseudomonadales bacterium]